jgi:hypothetical protein
MDVCGQAESWLVGINRSLAGADCSADDCSVQAQAGSAGTEFSFTALDGLASSTCSIFVTVRDAKLELEPSHIELTSLSTAFGEETMKISNEGDDIAMVLDIQLSAPWLTVSDMRDASNVIVDTPVALQAGSYLIVTLRGEGQLVVPGDYATNATVVWAGGQPVVFSIAFTVTPANLRVLVLPTAVPTVQMLAGDGGLSRLLTIYNVDVEEIEWWVQGNCTTAAVQGTSNVPVFSFSQCQSAALVPIGESVPMTINYVAPQTAGDYSASMTFLGARPGDTIVSQWTVVAEIQVLPNALVPSASTCAISSSLVAGVASPLTITPRDAYGNIIAEYGLEFSTLATHGVEYLLFESYFDFGAEVRVLYLYICSTMAQCG